MADAEYMKYKDPKQPINSRIRDLIGRMTLAEKIGQMTQIERQVASANVMKKYFIGKFYISPESFAVLASCLGDKNKRSLWYSTAIATTVVFF
jgi:hypothetical protein